MKLTKPYLTHRFPTVLSVVLNSARGLLIFALLLGLLGATPTMAQCITSVRLDDGSPLTDGRVDVPSGYFKATWKLRCGTLSEVKLYRNGTLVKERHQAAAQEISYDGFKRKDSGMLEIRPYGTGDPATKIDFRVGMQLPSIVDVSPGDGSFCASTAAIFAVEAAGTSPLTFEWRDPGGNRVATQPTFARTLSPSDSGTWTVTVANELGKVKETFEMEITAAPKFTQVPQDQNVLAGEPMTLTAEFEGDGDVSVQWFKEGKPLDGETDFELDLEPEPEDSGVYTVRGTNECGSVEASASVTVIVPPAIVSVSPEEASFCVGSVITFQMRAAGTLPFGIEWRNPAGQVVSTEAVFTKPAALEDAGEWTVSVTNMWGGEDRNIFIEATQAPTITKPLSELVVVAQDDDVTLTVEMDCQDCEGQWYRGDELLEDETEPELALSFATTDDAGKYRYVVTNACGSAETIGRLVVLVPPFVEDVQPGDDDICRGEETEFSVTVSGSEPLTIEWRNPKGELVATNVSFVRPVAVEEAGEWIVKVSNAAGRDEYKFVLGVLSAPEITACEVVGKEPAKTGQTATLTVSFRGGGEIQWYRGDKPIPNATQSSLVLTNLSEADAGRYVVLVSNPCDSAEAETVLELVLPPENLQLAWLRSGDGSGPQLVVTGCRAGHRYLLEGAADLLAWEIQVTATAVGSELKFPGLAELFGDVRFFRVRPE